jgi:ABC-type glycerol-3-phosphate transport system substrate-binding protein
MKKLWIIMCVLFLSVVLVACGGNTDNVATTDPGEQGSETPVDTDEETSDETGEETSSTSSNPNASPEMDFDLGGRTLTFVSWWDMSIPEDNPDNIQKKANLEALMEKHNFNVEYISIDFQEYQEKVVASLMAGEPLGDYVRMGKRYMIPSLVKQDMFWPVDEWTKNDNVFNQKVTNEYSVFEGRGYGFNDQPNLITGIFYNRTLMNELGIKPLQDYVDEDNWNWETFIQVAKDANRDTNNDGQIDTWGLAKADVLDMALAANETDLVAGDKHNLDDPKAIEVFNFISRIATEQVARPSEGGDWTEPRAFFVQGNVLMYPGAMYEASGLMQDMADYDIGFLPFPKGPSASTYHAVEPDVQFLTIPKTVENPRELLYIYEKIHDIESIYDYPDQATLETLFYDEKDINNARIAGENMIVIDRQAYPSLPYYDFLGELQSGVSVSTVVEKYKAPFQAAIDEVWQN